MTSLRHFRRAPLALLAAPALVAATAFGQTPPPLPTPPAATSGAPSAAPPTQPPWVMLPSTPSGDAAPPPPPPAPGAPALPPPGAAAPPPSYGGSGYPPVPPPYGYPPPGYYGPWGPPPPVYVPPERRPGYHLHHGLYFRMAFGIAFHNSRLSYPFSGLTTAGASIQGSASDKLSGTGFAIDAAIGGSPVPGFILAFDLGGHDATGLSQNAADGTSVQGLSYSRVGALVDWYPNPRGGFHVQGGAGFATASLDVRTPDGAGVVGRYPDTLGGFQSNAGIGWEGWVGHDWAVGALFRFDWASLHQTVDGQNAKLTIATPALLVSLTFN